MRTGSLGLLEAHLTTPDCGPVATLFPSVRLSPRPPSHRPPPPPPTTTMPLPAMTHSSAFLLPASTTPPPNDAATTYALVVLNQRLPRFAPLLWARGDAPLLSLPPSLPASMPRFCHCLHASGSPDGFSPWLTRVLLFCSRQRACACARTGAPTASSTACRSCCRARTPPISAPGDANLNFASSSVCSSRTSCACVFG